MARSPGPVCPGFRVGARLGATLVAALLVFAAGSLAPERAAAQGVSNPLRFQQRPPQPKPPPVPANGPMLVQATEIKYDYTNNTVAAVGNVQIYYNGATIEADEVTYDQKTKRLLAQGNVRLTEADGKITYGQIIDLTDDYRDGFVDSLRLETADDTRFAAQRADRSQGNYTVLQNGVYTACEPCANDPKKPPLWQVQGGADHPRSKREDALLRRRSRRVLRRAARLGAVHVGARSDRQAQERISVSDGVGHDAIRLRRRGSLLLGAGAELRPHRQHHGDDAAGRTVPGRMAPSPDGRRLFDQGRRHFSAGPRLFRRPRRREQPDRRFVPRRRSDRRSVRARRPLGLGLDRHPGHRFPVLERLPAQPVHAVVRPVPHRHRLRRRFPGLPDRHRRPQLFRHTLDLLLRLFATGRAKPAAGHPSGARLFQRAGAASGGRRVQLQDQSHQPQPAGSKLRRHQPDRRQQRLLREQHRRYRSPQPRPTACCAASRAITARFSAETDWRRTLVTYNGQEITPFFRLRGDFAAAQHRQSARRRQLHRHRPKRPRPRHADRRRRVSLSVRRRRTVGHADHRADRATDRAAERDADRQVSQRRRPEPGVRRQQSVQDRQVLRLGPRRGRRPRQCGLPVHRPDQPGRLRQRDVRRSPISCSARIRSPPASTTSPIPD